MITAEPSKRININNATETKMAESTQARTNYYNYRPPFNCYFVYAELPLLKQCQCIFSWRKRMAETEPRPSC